MKITEQQYHFYFLKYTDTPDEEIGRQLNITEEQMKDWTTEMHLNPEEIEPFAKQSDGIGKKFMHLTRYLYLSESDQELKKPCPPAFKKVEGDVIPLPKPDEVKVQRMDFLTASNQRRSTRQYAQDLLSLDELSYLLWSTQGVKLYREKENLAVSIRTVPSAGARHALETYLMIRNVEGLREGLYFYDAQNHALVVVDLSETILDRVSLACWNQGMIKHAAVTFIWTAIPYRMRWRYGERTYRYLHLDAGHVCQNLYLAGEAIDCGTCAIAAYSDELFTYLLDLEEGEEFVIYVATIGRKDSKEKK